MPKFLGYSCIFMLCSNLTRHCLELVLLNLQIVCCQIWKRFECQMEVTPLKKDCKKFEGFDVDELLRKKETLVAKEKSVDEEISALIGEGVNIDLKPEMQALHEYNDMKDLTQVVLGYLADLENICIAKLHEKYNLPLQ